MMAFEPQAADPDISERVGNTSLVAMLIGLLFTITTYRWHPAGDWAKTLQELLHELGVVLVSVFGISYLYEKISAEHQFAKFEKKLTAILRRGETNASMCEKLGIQQIFDNRTGYEEQHSLANRAKELGHGDCVRVIGRSLVYLLDRFDTVDDLLHRGVSVELCLLDPEIQASKALESLSGYTELDSQRAARTLRQGLESWLTNRPTKNPFPKQRVEIKLHSLDLTDSLIQVVTERNCWAEWDINFRGGKDERSIFVLDGSRNLGKQLIESRYALIWTNANSVFLEEHGKQPNHMFLAGHN
jgi:hypothetical protein